MTAWFVILAMSVLIKVPGSSVQLENSYLYMQHVTFVRIALSYFVNIFGHTESILVALSSRTAQPPPVWDSAHSELCLRYAGPVVPHRGRPHSKQWTGPCVTARTQPVARRSGRCPAERRRRLASSEEAASRGYFARKHLASEGHDAWVVS